MELAQNQQSPWRSSPGILHRQGRSFPATSHPLKSGWSLPLIFLDANHTIVQSNLQATVTFIKLFIKIKALPTILNCTLIFTQFPQAIPCKSPIKLRRTIPAQYSLVVLANPPCHLHSSPFLNSCYQKRTTRAQHRDNDTRNSGQWSSANSLKTYNKSTKSTRGPINTVTGSRRLPGSSTHSPPRFFQGLQSPIWPPSQHFKIITHPQETGMQVPSPLDPYLFSTGSQISPVGLNSSYHRINLLQ